MALKYPKTFLKAEYPAAYARIMGVSINDAVVDGKKKYNAIVSVTTFADDTKDTPLFGVQHQVSGLAESELTYPKLYEAVAALPEYEGNEPA